MQPRSADRELNPLIEFVAEIWIGEQINVFNQKQPNMMIPISQHEKEILQRFANTRKDKNMNTIYIINDVEFQIMPKRGNLENFIKSNK